MTARRTILVIAIALIATTSAAQDGSTRLSTGFMPDPLRLTGRTAGEAPLASRAPGCRGHVGGAPDHVVRLDTRFGFLRFFVVAPEEVTLALRGPDGRWHCAGRLLEGAPREEGTFEPGVYEVWIGSLVASRNIAYELAVTEFQSVTPATGRTSDEAMPVGGGAQIGLDIRATTGRYQDPRFRGVRRGFLPDPRRERGEAGGAIDAALLGGECAGFVDAQPSHVLSLESAFDYFRVHIEDAPGHTTLIVRAPDGRYYCSSPERSDAFVESASWSEGRYLIWVGSRAPSERPRYRIAYTEVRPAQ